MGNTNAASFGYCRNVLKKMKLICRIFVYWQLFLNWLAAAVLGGVVAAAIVLWVLARK